MSRTRAEVDLDAVAANVGLLADLVAPAALCAVVKADGYGHGAVPVARAALAAGATWLAVAMAAEGAELRAAGIDGPILVLSEPLAEEVDLVVSSRLTPTVYSKAVIDALASGMARAGVATVLPVHLKVDTGMHRVGAAPDDAVALAASIGAHPALVLEGVWTHCAVADEPDHPFTAVQAERFEEVLGQLRQSGFEPPVVHAANSAAAIDCPDLRFDLVRCGIAIYGLAPSPALEGRVGLHPVLRLTSVVSHVKVVSAGEAVSYGLRHRVASDTVVATVPIGYADGVPRRFADVGGSVLVGGVRRPVIGTVTMDQLLVDCGPAGDAQAESVQLGDEVVLVGTQGAERIGVEDWARWLDTISYEVTCSLSVRVPRSHLGGPR